MRAYVITTGIIFALLALAHVGRVFAERASLAKDPWFAIITLISAALAGWAWRVSREASGGSRGDHAT
jgi:hypothetical protein